MKRYLWTAVLAFYVAVRLNLWSALAGDELFTLDVISGNWRHLFTTALADKIHPPIYYIWLKMWAFGFGHSVMSLRSFSLLCAILVLPVVWAIAKDLELGGWAKAFLFTAVTLNPILIEHSSEVRMYSVLLLLSLLSIWISLIFVDPGESWLILIINTMLLLTHLSGAVIVGTELLYYIGRKRKITLKLLIAFIPVTLWFVGVYWFNHGHKLLSGVAWIKQPRPYDVVWFFASILGRINLPHTAALLCLVGMALCTVALWRSEKAVLLAMLTVSSPLAFYVGSFIHPMWSDRYLIASIVPGLALMACGVHRLTAVRQISVMPPRAAEPCCSFPSAGSMPDS